MPDVSHNVAVKDKPAGWNRKCLECGADPWPNYFYCGGERGCHNMVTNRQGPRETTLPTVIERWHVKLPTSDIKFLMTPSVIGAWRRHNPFYIKKKGRI